MLHFAILALTCHHGQTGARTSLSAYDLDIPVQIRSRETAHSREGKLVASYPEPIVGIAWGQGRRLLIATRSKVKEWPTGRVAILPTKRSSTSESPDSVTVFSLNSSKSRALGDGFVLDLKSFKARPYTVYSKDYISFSSWEGDHIVEVHSDGAGHFALVRGGRKTRLAPGWYVLGISGDHRYALASKNAPFDGDTTFLLRVDPKTGKANKVAQFPKSSDDHLALNSVEPHPATGKLLFHKTFLPNATQHPYFSSDLKPVRFPTTQGVTPTNERLDWISGSDVWLTLKRQFFHESPPYGFDASVLDLWNRRTGETRRIAKETFGWGPGSNDPQGRSTAPHIGPYAVDWQSRQLAFAVTGPKGSRIYVYDIRR